MLAFWRVVCETFRKIVDSKYFGRGIMVAILINTLSMGIEYHEQVSRLGASSSLPAPGDGTRGCPKVPSHPSFFGIGSVLSPLPRGSCWGRCSCGQERVLNVWSPGGM